MNGREVLNCCPELQSTRAEREGGDKGGEKEECVCIEQETGEGGRVVTETKGAVGSDVTC